MKNYFSVICLIIISCFSAQTTAKCPSAEILLPCSCETYDETRDYISCGGNNYYDLKCIFVKLSSALNQSEKHFDSISLSNTAINELVSNVFHDITFETISISSAYNLSRINTNAFNSTNSFVKQFYLMNTPYGNITDNNNIFNALNGMVNIERIVFMNTSLTSIPSNAFSVLNRLQSLTIRQNSNLKSIGDYAFYDLNNLTLLYIAYNAIESISDHAFSFRNNSTTTLSIVLVGYHNLSLSNRTFATINRTFDLRLSLFVDSFYLDKNIFGSALANGNRIELTGTPLVCNCGTFWLYRNRAQYQDSVRNAVCTDGETVFVDRPAYNACKTTFK